MTTPLAPAPRYADRYRSQALFDWRGGDGSLTPRTGQVPTFARASVGSAVPDQQGRLWAPVHSQPAWAMVDADSDGVRDELGLLLDPARTNLVLQSENFGTTWAAIGTPTRLAGALTLGNLSLDLIGDDNGAGLEGYSQTIVFTGDAVKAFSVYVAQNTSTQSIFRIVDGANERMRLSLQWSAGVPQLVTVEGTALLATGEYVGTKDGRAIYRLHVQTEAITAGGTNSLQIYPATTTAFVTTATGGLYCGGVQCENAPFTSGYVKTTAATVARPRDVLTYAIGFLPQDLTIYARLARPTWASLAGDLVLAPGILSIGTGNNRLEVFFSNATRVIGIQSNDNAGTGGSVTTAVPAGNVIEVCAQLMSAKFANQVRIDVGGGFSAPSASNGPFGAAWGSAILALGDLLNAGGNCLGTPLLAAKIFAGARSLAQCR